MLIRASTDLAADGRFGRQWLVATEHRVLVVPTQGEIVDIPLAALAEVRTDALVGGGPVGDRARGCAGLVAELHQLGGRKDVRGGAGFGAVASGSAVCRQWALGPDPLRALPAALAGEKRHLSGVYKKIGDPQAHCQLSRPVQAQSGRLGLRLHRYHGCRTGPAADYQAHRR